MVSKQAAAGGSGAKKIPRELRAIVDKACCGDAARGYSSAYALAEDLRAYRDRRPVAAAKHTPLDRMILFARRSPVLFFPVLALLVTVLGAAIYSYAMETAASRARDQAQSRLRQLQRLTYTLESDIYQPVSQLPNSQSARRALIQWASQSLDDLSREAGNDPRLREQMVVSYQRLAAVLRDNGQPAEARDAEAKAQALLAKDPKR